MALSIPVGQADDGDVDGLAHLLEHVILRLPNQKFPDSDEIHSFVKLHGGNYSAVIQLHHMAFSFTGPPTALEGLVERVAAAFSSPLFDEDIIKKEGDAIDDEFWVRSRDFEVVKDILKRTQLHPAHSLFEHTCLGNKSTLGRPDIRKRLEAFWKTHYSSDAMNLFVSSPKHSLDELDEMVAEHFGTIPKGSSSSSLQATPMSSLPPSPYRPARVLEVYDVGIHYAEFSWRVERVTTNHSEDPVPLIAAIIRSKRRLLEGPLLLRRFPLRSLEFLITRQLDALCIDVQCVLYKRGHEHIPELIREIRLLFKNLADASSDPQEWSDYSWDEKSVTEHVTRGPITDIPLNIVLLMINCSPEETIRTFTRGSCVTDRSKQLARSLLRATATMAPTVIIAHKYPPSAEELTNYAFGQSTLKYHWQLFTYYRVGSTLPTIPRASKVKTEIPRRHCAIFSVSVTIATFETSAFYGLLVSLVRVIRKHVGLSSSQAGFRYINSKMEIVAVWDDAEHEKILEFFRIVATFHKDPRLLSGDDRQLCEQMLEPALIKTRAWIVYFFSRANMGSILSQYLASLTSSASTIYYGGDPTLPRGVDVDFLLGILSRLCGSHQTRLEISPLVSHVHAQALYEAMGGLVPSGDSKLAAPWHLRQGKAAHGSDGGKLRRRPVPGVTLYYIPPAVPGNISGVAISFQLATGSTIPCPKFFVLVLAQLLRGIFPVEIRNSKGLACLTEVAVTGDALNPGVMFMVVSTRSAGCLSNEIFQFARTVQAFIEAVPSQMLAVVFDKTWHMLGPDECSLKEAAHSFEHLRLDLLKITRRLFPTMNELSTNRHVICIQLWSELETSARETTLRQLALSPNPNKVLTSLMERTLQHSPCNPAKRHRPNLN